MASPIGRPFDFIEQNLKLTREKVIFVSGHRLRLN